MMAGDVLLQWQDESGAWQRGYAVETLDIIQGNVIRQWFYHSPAEIECCKPDDIINPDSQYPLADYALLVMPLYAKRPVAVWVEIGKLTVVPDRTD